jgi:hypothetical protein
MKKIVFLLLAVGIALAGGIGYWLWNKPHQDMSKAGAAFALSAEELLAAYEADEAAADALYLGKIVEVSGTVSQVVEGENTTVVLGADEGIFGIRCELDPFSALAFPDYQAGEVVRLKGECTGFLGDVVLMRCVPASD